MYFVQESLKQEFSAEEMSEFMEQVRHVKTSFDILHSVWHSSNLLTRVETGLLVITHYAKHRLTP